MAVTVICKGGSVFWLMVSVPGELFLGAVKEQNFMLRNTYMIAEGCSHHGQRKSGREREKGKGREGGKKEKKNGREKR